VIALAININNQTRTVDLANDAPFLWVLRGVLGIIGTWFGCSMRLCGACTVYFDGAFTPVDGIGAAKITTIEAIEKGTNLEELVAAAHSGCFTMTLIFQLQGAGFTSTEFTTGAVVTLKPEGQRFRIRRSALVLRAKVPNLDGGACSNGG
jgi:hypothetical protein